MMKPLLNQTVCVQLNSRIQKHASLLPVNLSSQLTPNAIGHMDAIAAVYIF
jgi:hypothetical protein